MSLKDAEILRKFIEESEPELTFFENKLCILMYLHFKELEKTTFYSGVRQRTISRLISENKESKLELPDRSMPHYTENRVARLAKMTVKSFRGFQSQQEFSFGSKFTFIYGRNGTGKSSFVDAIEFSLMDSIQEAKFKRIDIEEYIKNIYTNTAMHPVLIGVDDDGSEIKVTPNPEQFNFAIVERNRIENFARISAETTSVQQQRLATLVGLDTWNKFVSGFSKDIDNYMPYVDELDKQLSEAKAKFESNNKRFSDLEEALKGSNANLKDLLEKYDQKDRKKLDLYFITQKRNINLKLNSIGDTASLPEKLLSNVETMQQFFLKTRDTYHKDCLRLKDYKDDLSLVELAKVILKQKAINSDNCPACLTPIRNASGSLMVKVDPYKHATEVQKNFEAATTLEKQTNSEYRQLNKQARELEASLRALNQKLELVKLSELLPTEPLINALDDLFDEQKVIPDKAWISQDDFLKAKAGVKEFNEGNATRQARKQQLQSEMADLNKAEGIFVNSIGVLDNAKARQEQLKLDIKNSKQLWGELIDKAKEAKRYNASFKSYADAYKGLVGKLKHYTEQLPIIELSNLNELTLKIYNLINQYDFESEQLTNLELPTSANEVIKIKFNVQDAPLVNALDVLSEGHIRTLGLAILLAKALKNDQLFIVFDDVVNAIDDDHRKAIAELITDTKDIFSNVQWIVTTHGQEFAKQLISATPQSLRPEIKEITFKSKGICSDVQPIDRSQNYIVLASKRLEEEDVRGCLADCRRELEVIMVKLWKLFSKRFHERISILVDLSRPDPETKNVLTTLNSSFKKKLKGNADELAVMSPVIEILDKILDDRGIDWFLVNKGTHEEENGDQLDCAETKILLNERIAPLDEYLTSLIKVKNSRLISVGN